jgi:propanol-preferring alcohol dehydrogenase
MEAVSPILCAGITVYKGLKESNARPGQTVAIVGAGGGLGSIACQYAKAMGLKVIGIDTGDEKKQAVMKLGATSFVDFATSKNVVKDVQAATEDGLGPHAVILVAVNEKPFQQAAEVCFSSLTSLKTLLPAPANKYAVRPPTWHRGHDWSPSWRLPEGSCLRLCHQASLH